MRLFRFDDPAHAEASALLPWFANGTLNARERSSVERHVGECVACRRDLAELSHLQEALQEHDDLDIRSRSTGCIRSSTPAAAGSPAVGGLKDKWDSCRSGARCPVQWAEGPVATAMLLGRPAGLILSASGAPLAPGRRPRRRRFASGTAGDHEARSCGSRAGRRRPNAAGAHTLSCPPEPEERLAAFRARPESCSPSHSHLP
jgi:hypothetical protein